MEQSSARNEQERKAQVQDYFSRTAASYVVSASHRSGSDLKRLIEVGEWQPDQRALDVATGGGHTALAVAPHVAQITASDLTPPMLEAARGYLQSQGITNADFQIADAEALSFPDASFDRVTCRIAPHHFPNVGKAVREIARVLKPGGLFLLIDSIAPADAELDRIINRIEKWRDPSHGRSFTQEEWQTFFADAGLTVELTETFRRPLDFEDWAARAQMSYDDRQALADYILSSSAPVREHFSVTTHADGSLQGFSLEYILLKGRKAAS